MEYFGKIFNESFPSLSFPFSLGYRRLSALINKIHEKENIFRDFSTSSEFDVAYNSSYNDNSRETQPRRNPNINLNQTRTQHRIKFEGYTSKLNPIVILSDILGLVCINLGLNIIRQKKKKPYRRGKFYATYYYYSY